MTESIGKPKDLWKALKSLGLSNKISSYKVKALKINNTVKHNVNLVLEGFKCYYSTLAENLVKLLPKPPSKYSVNTVIKYYEHMIRGDHFNLASVSESPILTILKATKVSKATGLDNWSGCFLKDEAKLLSKPITDLCNLSITSEKSPDSYIVAKLKPLHKKGFFNSAL